LLHLQKSAKCPKKGLKMEKNSKNTFFWSFAEYCLEGKKSAIVTWKSVKNWLGRDLVWGKITPGKRFKMRLKSEISRSRPVPISKSTGPISVLKSDLESAWNYESDGHPFQPFIWILGGATPGCASRSQEAGEEADAEQHPGSLLSVKFWVESNPGSPFYLYFGRSDFWRRLLEAGGGGGVGSRAAPRILTQREILSEKDSGISSLRHLGAELQNRLQTLSCSQSRLFPTLTVGKLKRKSRFQKLQLFSKLT
jgi:hypothetical protein